MTQLYYREYGEPGSGSPLVFLHGLFGSSANWGSIARRLSQTHYCIVPDLRNHGRSFHDDAVGYGAQSGDVVDLLDALDIDKATLIGHSMGGKVAMFLALHLPDMVDKLVVADMSPRAYTQSFGTILSAMQQIDLKALQNRSEADAFLAHYIDASGVRAYLLQNLVRAEAGWQWRINITALSAGIEQIMDFPVDQGRQYHGPACFIYGENSNYVDEEGKMAIGKYFPDHQLRKIEKAGHWVYADQPQTFIEALSAFIE